MSTFDNIGKARTHIITWGHELAQDDSLEVKQLIEKGYHVYTQSSLQQYMKDVVSTGDRALIEKAHKDLGKLVKKTITDKTGHQKTVWVNPNHPEGDEQPHMRFHPETGEDAEAGDKQSQGDSADKHDDQDAGGGSGSSAEVDKILKNPNLKQSDKIRSLFAHLGTHTDAKKAIADKTGAHYSRVCQLAKEHEAGGGARHTSHDSSQAEKAIAAAPRIQANVDDRWDSYGMFVDMVADGMAKSCIAFGTGGVGKFNHKDSKIATPTGWTTHGTVKPGDVVLTPKGTKATVLQVFPQGVVDLYRLTLSDGSSILTGSDHLWLVYDKTHYWDKDKKERVRGGRYTTMTTKDILKKGLSLRKESVTANGNKIWPEWRFLIPYLPVPVAHEHDEALPIDPYVLGALIGDGCFTQKSVTFTSGKDDQDFMVESLSKGLENQNVLVKKQTFPTSNGIDFTIAKGNGTTSNEIIDALRELKLMGCNSYSKFIPDAYKYASVENRLRLIQGLMDTDGTIGKNNGVCTYYTVSEQLANDVRQIIKSFGRGCTIRKQDRKFTGLAAQNQPGDDQRINTSYEINFSLPEQYCPFSLPRKVEVYEKFNRRADVRGLGIVGIELETRDEAFCISIDDADMLYLTDDYTMTHNTYTVQQSFKARGLRMYDEGEGTEDNPGHELGSDQYDAVKITGKATASAIYQAMFEHNGKILIFDDCDSALKDEDAVNLFKGALDTSGDGTIAYGGGKSGAIKTEAKHGKRIWRNRKGPDPDDIESDDETGQVVDKRVVPPRFKFKGQVVFISNLSPKEMPQPLVDSRSLSVDLSMTPEETIDRMGKIIGKMSIEDAKGNTIDISQEDRQAIVGFLDKHKDNIRVGKLNARTLGNIAKIKHTADIQGKDWEKMAEIMLYS